MLYKYEKGQIFESILIIVKLKTIMELHSPCGIFKDFLNEITFTINVFFIH